MSEYTGVKKGKQIHVNWQSAMEEIKIIGLIKTWAKTILIFKFYSFNELSNSAQVDISGPWENTLILWQSL